MPATPQHDPYDVVVVGARCAGSAAARLLALRGHDVLLLERAALPSDTLSTHGLARGAVVQLARWGLLPTLLDTGTPAVREATFGLDGTETTRPIKAAAGVDCLVAPRRTVLDALLATEAVAAGATLRTGTTVTDLVRDGEGRVTGVRTRDRDGSERVHTARLVVGADGLRSTVARLAGARTTASFASEAAIFYAYVEGLPPRGFEFHVARAAYAGVFPTHDDQSCVWLSRPAPELAALRTHGPARLGAWLAQLDAAAPGLAGRVRKARVASPLRGAVAMPNHVREAYGVGWALVGDAGYHRDPITGHGITDAFRDAELLADAADALLRDPAHERDALAAYQAARDAALAPTWRLTRELTRFPEPTRFVALQKQLSEALEQEATELASRPAPAGTPATTHQRVA